MNEKKEVALTENEYSDLLNSAINQIHSARNALALQINTTSNTTYWNLGMLLHDRKKAAEWMKVREVQYVKS